MKILIVSKCPTHPTNSGNRRFIISQIELLQKMGHTIHYLFIEEDGLFSRDLLNKKAAMQMKDIFKERFHLYRIGKLQKIVFNVRQRLRRLLNQGYMKCDDFYPTLLTSWVKKLNRTECYDACIINYYYLSKLFLDCPIPLKAITTHDYFAYKDQLVGVKNVVNNTTAHEEAKALQRCNHIFALNTEEAIYFKKLAPKSTVYNVYSSYSVMSQPIVKSRKLLFLSGNNYYNVMGLKWFLKDIYPFIVKSFPDVQLLIAGSICKEIASLGEKPNVLLMGFVENEADFYAQGDVVINPTYLGTGLKIKTFESLSYGKVTMAHPHSVQGIFAPEKAPVFVSTHASEWVDFLKKIWNNPKEIVDISQKSLNYISNMNDFIEQEYCRFLKA